MARINNLTVINHPLINHRLTLLRNKNTSNADFQRLTEEITYLIGYEALHDLAMQDIVFDTPIQAGVRGDELNQPIMLVPILRAGLSMIAPLQKLLPNSIVAHVGVARDEKTLQPHLYLNKLPFDLSEYLVIICDPMLATGGTLSAITKLAVANNAKQIISLNIVASTPGINNFHQAFPEVKVICAAQDFELTDKGYIKPGLGDAGDRLFGAQQ